MKVELIDSMGSDLSVCNAARVSFAKESDWENNNSIEYGFTKNLNEKDQKLISYLANHGHWTPFAHAFLSFRIKAPIFVARQLVKHQVGLAWNEVSRRYVDDEPEFYLPVSWRKRPDGSVKQGSSQETIEEVDGVLAGEAYNIEEVCYLALDWYRNNIANGMAPEQARMVLPQNTMTEWWWSGSLAAFSRVCKQRLDSHAQAETREIATMINDIAAERFPHSWKALQSN